MQQFKSKYMQASFAEVRQLPTNGKYESIVNYHLKDQSVLVSKTTHVMEQGVEVGASRVLEAYKDGKLLMKTSLELDKETNNWNQISPPPEMTIQESKKPQSPAQPLPSPKPKLRVVAEPDMEGPDM